MKWRLKENHEILHHKCNCIQMFQLTGIVQHDSALNRNLDIFQFRNQIDCVFYC